MRNEITENHTCDNGRPDGGTTFGPGFAIGWQRGALGRGDDRLAQNGAFVEDVIQAALGRLDHYQESPFRCEANADAAMHLAQALECLRTRTAEREARKVEGTHAI